MKPITFTPEQALAIYKKAVEDKRVVKQWVKDGCPKGVLEAKGVRLGRVSK